MRRKRLATFLFCIAVFPAAFAGGPVRAQDGNTGARGLSFHGIPCTKDCSGHRAGYAWAQRKGIDDPASCSGRSRSFVEGCRIGAVDRAAGKSGGAEETHKDAISSPSDSAAPAE